MNPNTHALTTNLQGRTRIFVCSIASWATLILASPGLGQQANSVSIERIVETDDQAIGYRSFRIGRSTVGLDSGDCLIAASTDVGPGIWWNSQSNGLTPIVSPSELKARNWQLNGLESSEPVKWVEPLFGTQDQQFVLVTFKRNSNNQGIWAFGKKGEECLLRVGQVLELPSVRLNISAFNLVAQSNKAAIIQGSDKSTKKQFWLLLTSGNKLQLICKAGQFLSDESDSYIDGVGRNIRLTANGEVLLTATVAGPGFTGSNNFKTFVFHPERAVLEEAPPVVFNPPNDQLRRRERPKGPVKVFTDLVVINDGKQQFHSDFLALYDSGAKIWSSTDRNTAKLIVMDGREAPGMSSGKLIATRVLAKTNRGNLLIGGAVDIERPGQNTKSLSSLWLYQQKDGQLTPLLHEGQSLPKLGRGYSIDKLRDLQAVVLNVFRGGHIALQTSFTGPQNNGRAYWILSPNGKLILVAADGFDLIDGAGRSWQSQTVFHREMKFAESDDQVFVWFKAYGAGRMDHTKPTLFRASLQK